MHADTLNVCTWGCSDVDNSRVPEKASVNLLEGQNHTQRSWERHVPDTFRHRHSVTFTEPPLNSRRHRYRLYEVVEAPRPTSIPWRMTLQFLSVLSHRIIQLCLQRSFRTVSGISEKPAHRCIRCDYQRRFVSCHSGQLVKA